MQIKINENNEIVEFANVGGIDDSIEVDDSLKPLDFDDNFKSGYYLFQDNQIIVNPNYQEPTVVDPGPSQTQQQLAQVTYQQMMTTQDVTTLQAQNAQIAYQLMMMKKQGGEA